MSEYSRLIAAV